MGIYYRGISKRTRTVKGVTFAFTNFHGKAPVNRVEPNRAWNTFVTKSSKTADEMALKVNYVVMANTITEMAEYGETVIAAWNGQSTMDDHFWDTKAVGKVIKRGKRWQVEFSPA